MGIEKIKAFEFPKLSDGNANGIEDFFKQIVKPQFSNRQSIINTHNALMEYLKLDGKVFFLRLYGSYPKDRYFLLRRGFLTEYPDKTKMAFCDNTFSMLFTGLKIAGLTYTSNELKSFLTQNKVICSFLTTKEERELSYYKREGAINLNLNSKGWYLAHIKPTGTGFDKRRLRDIFPNPSRSEWDIETKIRRTKTNLNDTELKILKAQFIRLIHPLNSFLVPKKNHLLYSGKNIGEEAELLKYTQDFLKNEFHKEYKEFNNITLEYDFPEINNTIDEIAWFKDKIKEKVNKKRNDETQTAKMKYPTNKRAVNVMKIGQFVRHVFRDAFEKGLITPTISKDLQNIEYSQEHFNAGYEILRDRCDERGIIDDNGRNRYYARELFCDNFRLSSQWYTRQWDDLLKWLSSIGYAFNESELNAIEKPKTTDANIAGRNNLTSNDIRNNFIVSQNKLGRGSVIQVTFKNGGSHDGETYLYEHDKLVESCREYLQQSPTWNNAGNWSNSNNIPSWAMNSGLIKKLK